MEEQISHQMNYLSRHVTEKPPTNFLCFSTGVASLSFTLPTLVKSGYWKIRTKIHDQIDEQRIKVELYYQPLFEVISPAVHNFFYT